MAVGRITKVAVDRLTPPEQGETWLWDATLKGFGVRVIPSGRKTFYAVSRPIGSRIPRKLKLGVHGAGLTVEEARQEARQRLADFARGDNPAALRSQRRGEPTLAAIVPEYLEELAARRKATTHREYARLLEKHVLPKVGGQKVTDIDRAMVARLHGSQRRHPYQANRTLAALSGLLSWAERRGLRPDGSNPCPFVERFPEKARDRFLSPAELARLGAVLTEAQTENRYSWPMIAAIRFLVLTGLRKGEALSLRWSHVNLATGSLALPDSKTGARAVPLGAPAVELLAELPRMASNDYVFPGLKPGRPIASLTDPWYDLRKRAGLEGVRLHDLRHSFASVGAGGGMSLLVIGSLLGHRNAGTTQRYAHLAEDPRKAAADRIADEIAASMRGPRSTEPVVPIRRARRGAGA